MDSTLLRLAAAVFYLGFYSLFDIFVSGGAGTAGNGGFGGGTLFATITILT